MVVPNPMGEVTDAMVIIYTVCGVNSVEFPFKVREKHTKHKIDNW